MKLSEKFNKKDKRLLFIGVSLILPLIAVIIIMSTYGMVQRYVNNKYESPYESGYMLEKLFKGNYVLYKNLVEKETGESKLYTDLYMKDIRAFAGDEPDNYNEEDIELFRNNGELLLDHVLEEGFSSLSPYFDYYAENTNTGVSISNTAEKPGAENYVYYLEVEYDEKGSGSVVSAKSEDSKHLRKNASECILFRNQLLHKWMNDYNNHYYFDGNTVNLLQYGDGPKNCRIIYGMTEELWKQFHRDGMTQFSYGSYSYYLDSNLQSFIMLAFLALVLLALFLPLKKWRGKDFGGTKYFNLPLEAVFCIWMFLMASAHSFLYSVMRLLNGSAAEDFTALLKLSPKIAVVLAYLTNGFLLYLLFSGMWYMGLTVRPLREKGFKRYIKENCIIYRIFPFCKRQMKKLYFSLEHIDVTKSATKTIRKVVLLNAVILFLISCLWFGGMMVTIVYSVLLYFGLKIYVSRMQKKYSILLEKIQEISDGNLNVEIKEDLGIFNPFKEQLLTIQSGFRNAVEEEVKSQKLKSELITNVSHDLKTPLTAIITYVDLLKDENLTPEQKKEYLNTLERKSLRLKVLIEDLFEVSKATSGNVTMNYVDVDICNLIKQVELEMSDKLSAANLDIRMDFPKEKVIVTLDSQKTYRIYENLFQNIAKYSLPGTRVYVQGTLTDNSIIISLKNISATEINVDASQLTERFVRGDVSRNTEGSGLGLAIAKSFVELQGGRFVLESDGDLFKAITSFPCKR